MNSGSPLSTTPGNTPIDQIPKDYYPEGCGFWFKIPRGRDKDKKMFFRDSKHGAGSPISTIVFVHGNPECSYTYRKIIYYLIQSVRKPFRIINMDHIGYGLSDQTSFQMVSMDHAANLFELIKFLDLHNVTLIIHDWGGPIGIGAFLKEPQRISNLIILNTTVFPLSKKGLNYNNYPISWLGWAKAPYIIPDPFWGSFASFAIFIKPIKPLKLLLRMCIYILKSELGILPRDELSARRIYKHQFKSQLNVRSSKRLVRQTPKWGHGNIYNEPTIGKRDTTPFYHDIQKNISIRWGLTGQKIGVRAVLGAWDPLGRSPVVKQWLTHLPQLRGHIKVFRNVGHFIEESEPEFIAETIMEVSKLK